MGILTTSTQDQEKEVVIEKLKFEARRLFTGTFMNNLKIDFINQAIFAGEGMLMQLQSDVLAVETRSLTRSLSYPANWWEMFKDQYFTDRMKRRFPVKYKTKRWNIKTYATYPEWDLVIPEQKAIYKHYVYEHEPRIFRQD